MTIADGRLLQSVAKRSYLVDRFHGFFSAATVTAAV